MGGSTATGLRVAVTGADANYAALFSGGNVGIGDATPAGLFTVGASDAFQVNNSGNVNYVGGTSDSNTLVCRNAAGQLAACTSAAVTGTAFIQNGNSFGAQAVLGTNDANSLAFETGGTTRLVLDTSGNLNFAGNNIISTSLSDGNLTINPNGNGTLLLGDNGTVQVGTSTGAIAQTINIGTNPTASSSTALTLGSTIDTSITTLQAGSGGIVINASTLKRTASGTTTLDLIDGSNTIFALTNSGSGNANLTVDGTGTISGLTDRKHRPHCNYGQRCHYGW